MLLYELIYRENKKEVLTTKSSKNPLSAFLKMRTLLEEKGEIPLKEEK